MTFESALADLECPTCAARQSADAIANLCTCGSPLLARYELERAGATLTKRSLRTRPAGLWRWRELLPVRNHAHIVSLGEPTTPIISLPRSGNDVGIARLSFKDEAVLPTGSFKARGAAVGVSRAKELGVRVFAMPTNGNAGGAWAAYGRRAGLHAIIAMPKSAPAIHVMECTSAGADVTLVDGLISDAGALISRVVAQGGVYDASTLKEPYRVEGKKTMGFEIAEQFDWDLPDVIVYPTGGGVGLIGIDKAFRELLELGWLRGRLPRMVAVQASGCAPIVKAWERGDRRSTMWDHAQSVAFGIVVPKAIGDFLVLAAVYATQGCAVAVDDEAIVSAQRHVCAEDDVLLCLEGAATFAAAAHLRESGWIRDSERVLLINTGSALKNSSR